MEKEFTLCAVHILPECDKNLRKVLKDEWYYLNDRLKIEKDAHGEKYKGIVTPSNQAFKDFYGKNISVSAIVGANGSGKSALLELIYRIINNLSCFLTYGMRRDASEILYYVVGLHAELHYIANGEWAYISCRGDRINLKIPGKREYTFDSGDASNSITEQECIEIAKSGLFFSIVTNYSIQSFVSEDFKNEGSHMLNNKEALWKKEKKVSWLDGLFHKNDGYTAALVLNPYRENGKIDIVKEHKLSLYRLASCFIYAQNTEYEFFPKYSLANINYKYDREILLRKVANGREIKKDEAEKLWGFRPYGEGSQTYAKVILESYGYTADSLNWDDEIQRMAALYLVYKTLKVANLYPGYEKFREAASVGSFLDTCSAENKGDLSKMVRFVKRKKSHETLKILQTIHFLEYCKERKTDMNLNGEFSYDAYINAVSGGRKSSDIWKIQEFLPPAIFTFDIMLRHNEKVTQKNGAEQIPIGRLSSGERQYLYMFSTYVYHILNILSVNSTDRVRYDKINLVLDEAEICFHPEYQRCFLNELLGCLTRLKMNEKAAINIIIATHSPLILSDIPLACTSYLTQGDKERPRQETFGANIFDLYHNSFFLEEGMIGEFAMEKIENVVSLIDDWKKRGRNVASDEMRAAKQIINLIANERLKDYLMDELSAIDKEGAIEYYQQKIDNLKQGEHEQN